MQRAEIEIAQPDLRKAIRPDESSCLSNAARIWLCNKAVAVNLCSDGSSRQRRHKDENKRLSIRLILPSPLSALESRTNVR